MAYYGNCKKDINIYIMIYDIIIEKYVKFFRIPEHITKIKIDIGLSYNAPQSQKWFEYDGDSLYVFGFEPNSECLESLNNKNIQKKHPSHGKPIENKYLTSNICIIPVALNNVTEESEGTFYQMGNDCGTSSLNYPDQKQLGNIKSITNVPIFSLKHFFDIFPWERFSYIEYMKIDAQGSDYDILQSADDYIERIIYITAEPECNQYADCSKNNTENIRKYLETKGFSKIMHPNTCDPTFLNTKFQHLANDIFIYQSD
jgi:hypothetical protein